MASGVDLTFASHRDRDANVRIEPLILTYIRFRMVIRAI